MSKYAIQKDLSMWKLNDNLLNNPWVIEKHKTKINILTN